MSENLVLEQYTPLPKEVTIDIDYWKNIIKNPPAHHATEDESSKSRPIQKPSKKIDCRCYATVTCYFPGPNQVIIKLHNEHSHLIESLDGIFFLPLSDNTKEAILQKLCGGYGRRDIIAIIQCHFNERIRDLFPVVVSQHPLQYMLFIVISLSIRKIVITCIKRFKNYHIKT
ncbi:hypothetical protein BCV71DRAFT_234834 [Rhizopus microsporus]|uniref:Uncharacterized protein n=1 Tax=Rhizopus microsporus TaxID=58291 RepID=A0A1X0S2Q6_RHIZD|nr:hypothetical protein BCV71DRAFT_234834 [Rhizopus microsporus]